MNSPARRKSSLSGDSPVTPVRPVDQPRPRPATIDLAAPRAGEEVVEQKPKYPHKVSFYQDREDTTRLRAAYRHNLARTGDRSLSHFIGRVVMTEVERLETEYNGGKPFPAIGSGELPQGRPVGE